jgi:dTDP-4-dehydrorhamnose reductase
MNILLLGKNGQLGWELERTLATIGTLVALDRKELDLEDVKGLRSKVRELRPQLIINAAAYTDVDRAESEPLKAFAINAIAPGILAEEANRLEAALIHYSTDYVFDGTKGSSYTEKDLPNPLNIYGKSKLAGEQAIQAVEGTYFILRTSWMYSLRRGGFVKKILEWARSMETVRIVNDQTANPTWARMLAEITAQVIAGGMNNFAERKGLYHLAGTGWVTRFDWAKLILALDPDKSEQKHGQILPALTSDFPTPSRRPLFSALDCNKFTGTFNLSPPGWHESLSLAMNT